jgi:hypothetical protein
LAWSEDILDVALEMIRIFWSKDIIKVEFHFLADVTDALLLLPNRHALVSAWQRRACFSANRGTVSLCLPETITRCRLQKTTIESNDAQHPASVTALQNHKSHRAEVLFHLLVAIT